MNDLKNMSIELILENQSSSGAYIASPNFPIYHYSWLRDGSFIAYAMLINGQIDSCRKFLKWVHGTIKRYKNKVDKIAFKIENKQSLHVRDFLPARYTLDGIEVKDDWSNFQIDGYGAWLWCLSEYSRITGDESLVLKFKESIFITIDYLKMVWKMPNYDCWEENGNYIHPSTLACIYGGIKGINRFIGEKDFSSLSKDINKFILSNLTEDGRFPKYIGSNSVDSSLLWLSVPFDVVEPDYPVMQKTVLAIEEKLLKKGGGVKRYPEDTYYGGGQWILITCWLAWYYLKIGKTRRAVQLYEWVKAQSDERGYLPEQVQTSTEDSDFVAEWEKRWGKAANPLLWSHAMYLVLVKELEKAAAYK